MCVIMVKPANVAFPEENILKNCWDNNPDMGGFMYALDGSVHIHKGYMTWESFYSALCRARQKTGDKIPYVCHFRISTQGHDKECCQPFPLTSKIKNMKKTRVSTNIGVAHNGILSITSDGALDYSDTMKFIADYLVNIIRSYSWYKDARNLLLIENLIEGSRFAILDKNGHCELLGSGWVEDNGVYYSNNTYKFKKYSYSPSWRNTGWWDDYGKEDTKRWNDYWDNIKKREEAEKTEKGQQNPEWLDPWNRYWNQTLQCYDFSAYYCPLTEENDDSYCDYCSHCGNCQFAQNMNIKKVSGLDY